MVPDTPNWHSAANTTLSNNRQNYRTAVHGTLRLSRLILLFQTQLALKLTILIHVNFNTILHHSLWFLRQPFPGLLYPRGRQSISMLSSRWLSCPCLSLKIFSKNVRIPRVEECRCPQCTLLLQLFHSFCDHLPEGILTLCMWGDSESAFRNALSQMGPFYNFCRFITNIYGYWASFVKQNLKFDRFTFSTI